MVEKCRLKSVLRKELRNKGEDDHLLKKNIRQRNKMKTIRTDPVCTLLRYFLSLRLIKNKTLYKVPHDQK